MSAAVVGDAQARAPGPSVPGCGPSPGPVLPADRGVTAAVVLEDGSVLLVGEGGGRKIEPWSALLDPRSGTVTDVATRPDRFVDRMARVPDGVVVALVTREPGGPVVGAARYEVAARTWRELPAVPACVTDDAPSLSDQRRPTPELIALSDGSALVVGHRCAVRLTASGAWVPAPSPPPARGFTLTPLRNGDVLRIGGLRTRSDDFDLEATREAHRFDTKAQQWISVASAPYFRYGHSAALLPDGRVLVVGGCEDSGTTCHAENQPAPPALLYDPAADRWEVLGAGSVTNRERGSATALRDGRVVILGGFVVDDSSVIAPGAQYQEGRWSELPGLGITRAGHVALAAGEHILLVGSEWDEGEPLQWYGAAASCATRPVELTAPPPPLEESSP